MSTDVLGYLVEVVSGMSFEAYLKTHIFNPLGMNDTAFSVPEEKADRYATLYEPAEDGGIQVIEKCSRFKRTPKLLPLRWCRVTIDRR